MSTAETKSSSLPAGQTCAAGDVARTVRRNNMQLLEAQERKQRQRELLEEALRETGAEPITPLGIVQKLFPEERPRTVRHVSNQMITARGPKRWAWIKVAVVMTIACGPLAAALVGGIWTYHLGLTSGGWLAGMIIGGTIWCGIFGEPLKSTTQGLALDCSAALCDVLQYQGLVPNDAVLAIQKLQVVPEIVFQVATRAGKQTVVRTGPRDPLLLARHPVTGEIWLLEAWLLEAEAGQ